ncbi:MAG: phosphate regulon sensor histidine kinase PhoR [Burkholderiaceae bacterium]|jgi:two-component system phosphate regulon sensor histidine kinase PhoR
MNQRALFWMPVLMRLGLVAVVMLAASFLWSGVIGLLLGFLLVLILALIQLNYLYRLSLWLENPEQVKLADGFGAWTDVFARLYRLRREDEKNRHELAEWLSRFRKAMSLLPDGVVIMDDVLFLEWCNPVAEQHLGLALERDKGMRVTNLIRSPDFIDYIILARYEQPLTLTLGERKLIVHLIPFENRRQILVTHDVTEAERLEQTRRDFIANASHELRTPLTVINGFLEIATGDDVIDPEVRRQHLQLMLEQGKRMQHLVEDMLSLTRLESIDYPVRAEPIDMHVMMEELKRDGDALSAGRHHIKLLVEDVALAGSNDELHSAFSNLVSNAVRYTPVDGNIDVIWRDSEAGPQFIVRDNGIGIRPEHIVRLTERFYRVDKGRSRASQGTGLGLAIVKHVLMRHNATLKIESEPGKGSAFIAQFPKVTALKA